MKKFKEGFGSYFFGFGFWTKNSSLLRLSILPLIVNFVFLVVGLYFCISHSSDLVNKIISPPEFWYQFVFYYFLYVVTAIGMFVVIFFLAITLANILTFPFYTLLADRALHIHEPPRKERLGFIKKMKVNFVSFVIRTFFFLVIGAGLLILAFIPGLAAVSGVIGVFLMAYDRLDYGFDHYGLTFGNRKAFIKSHFPEMIGFATAMGLTASIPVINILAQPAGVVAGALWVAKMSKNDEVEIRKNI